MSLLETAIDMVRRNVNVNEIRTILRETVLSCGDYPTCSAVEETIGEARRIVYSDDDPNEYPRIRNLSGRVNHSYPR